jgi:uncharacterized protein DUF5906
MADADTLTVLTSVNKLHAGKRFWIDKKGQIKVSGYGRETHFRVESVAVSDIKSLAQALERISRNPYSFVIRGELLPGLDPASVLRHSTTKPVTFKAAPRRWMLADSDEIPCPMTIDSRSDPEDAVEHVIGLLPPELWDASCWWQFSSQQSVYPEKPGLRLHLWFWLAQAYDDISLKRWAQVANAAAGLLLVDTAMFSAVQAHYLARPDFVAPLADPLIRRSGLRQGLDDAVELTIPDRGSHARVCESRVSSERPYTPGHSVEHYLGQISPTNTRGAVRSAIGAYIAINGSDADCSGLKDRIRKAIRTNRPGVELGHYEHDEHLDALIAWTKAAHVDTGWRAGPPSELSASAIPVEPLDGAIKPNGHDRPSHARACAELEARTGTSENIEPEPAGSEPDPPRGNGHDRDADAGSAVPSVDPGSSGGGALPPPNDFDPDAEDADSGDDTGDDGGDIDAGDDDDDSVSLGALDDEAVERYRAIIRQAAADKLQKLNRDYQVVVEAGKTIVMKFRRDPTLDREVLDRITFPDFKRMYLNRRIRFIVEKPGKNGVEIEIRTRNLAEWWLSHPLRHQYIGGVTFDPTGKAPADHLNLWRGFPVTPAPGDWSLLKDHIIRIVCRGELEHAEYVFNWMARLFQHPEEPGEIALVLRGKKGAGKSILGVWVARSFAHHGLQITHAGQLVGRFNAHLRDLVVLLADEAFFAGDKQHEGVLKGLVTERTVVIEGKYQAVVVIPNMLHLILASNSDWVIPASSDERRFAVFDVLDTRIGDRAYFAAIDRQMRQGGLAAMIYELRARDIANFEVRDVPQTAALQAQKTLSMSSLERWWLTVLSRGYLWRSRHGVPWFTAWHDFYSTELLMNSYLQWSSENRPYDRKSREQLKDFFDEIYAPNRPRGQHPVHEIDSIDRDELRPSPVTSRAAKTLDEIAIVRKDRARGYQVGELVEARVRFAEMRDFVSPWGGDSDE